MISSFRVESWWVVIKQYNLRIKFAVSVFGDLYGANTATAITPMRILCYNFEIRLTTAA